MLEFLVLSFIWTLCLAAGDNEDQNTFLYNSAASGSAMHSCIGSIKY